MVLYDMVNIMPTKIQTEKQTQAAATSRERISDRTLESASTPSISESGEDVNTKFSQDGQGIRYSIETAEDGRETQMSVEDAQKAYDGKSLTEDSEVYSYDFLTSLPDMKVTTLPDVDAVRDNQRVDTRAVVDMGMKNACTVGTERDGKVFVRNGYTGRQLLITSDSIRHRLNGGMNRLLTNARLGAVIGDVVKKAVPVNSLRNQAEGVTGTYAMAGYVADSKGREFVDIITVEQYDGKVAGIEIYDVTHAVSGRQKKSSQASNEAPESLPYQGCQNQYSRLSECTHQSILSDDVLAHFGEVRNENGDYAGKVRFSLKGSETPHNERLTGQNSVAVDPNLATMSLSAEAIERAEKNRSWRRSRFQSTPSAGRATHCDASAIKLYNISIHALRGEGDRGYGNEYDSSSHFNPRPPWGGRLQFRHTEGRGRGISIHAPARRATLDVSDWDTSSVFQSTPPAGRATRRIILHPRRRVISIHALRGEGDAGQAHRVYLRRDFNPRPPWGGRHVGGEVFSGHG